MAITIEHVCAWRRRRRTAADIRRIVAEQQRIQRIMAALFDEPRSEESPLRAMRPPSGRLH